MLWILWFLYPLMPTSYRILAAFSSILLLVAGTSYGASVSLAWNPNAEPDIARYHVLLGVAPGQYTQSIDAGPATTATVSNLSAGTTYFFAVTAHNTSGFESLPSSEVSYSVPGGPTPTPIPTPSPSPTPTPSPAPSLVITNQPRNLTVNAGQTATFSVTASGPGPLTYQWKRDSQAIGGATSSSYTTPPTIQTDNHAKFSVVVSSSAGSKTSTNATLTVKKPRRLANVSTRDYVQTGENVLIGGLIITGDTPKKVVLRAIGPSLAAAGMSNVMRDPMLSLHDSTGASIASNDNWRTGIPDITATGLAPVDDLEAAIVTTLAPGAYTVVVSGVGGSTGNALFEVYDVDPLNSTIANISTRGRVEDGDDVLIGGVIIGGDQPGQVVIRALGPSLGANGIADTLADPSLELYNDHGTRIYANDDWRSDQAQQIAATSLAPTDDRESAIIATLQPGNYTAVVRGAHHSKGVSLVEVYDVTDDQVP